MSAIRPVVVFTAWISLVCAPLTCGRASAQELQREGKPLSDWVEALKSEEDSERRQAAYAIASIGQQGEEGAAATVPVLIGCLKNDVTGVRWTAARGLLQIASGGENATAAAPALLETLQDRSGRSGRSRSKRFSESTPRSPGWSRL